MSHPPLLPFICEDQADMMFQVAKNGSTLTLGFEFPRGDYLVRFEADVTISQCRICGTRPSER